MRKEGKEMKKFIAFLCVLLSLATGASSAVAGGCPKGKGGCEPTRLVPAPKPALPLVERKCELVRTTEVATATYATPSLPAMYVAGPACCCTSSNGVYIPAVNGQVVGGTTTTIKTNLVCKDEVK